jgi:hypothetical protein
MRNGLLFFRLSVLLAAAGSTVFAETISASSRMTGLIFSEVMYHPANRVDMKKTGFVELYNTYPVPVDLTGFRLTGDIGYDFPSGTVMQPHTYLVVASAPADLQSVYTNLTGVLGPYSGSLGNDSGVVRLRSPGNGIFLEVDYTDSLPWPVAADGSGHSLVLLDNCYGENDPRSWRQSTYFGGSPGTADPVAPVSNLVINEFAAHTDVIDPLYDSNDWLELFNRGTNSISTANMYLSDDPEVPNKWALPLTTIPAGGWISYDEMTGFHNPLTSGFGMSMFGEQLVLSYLPGNGQDRILDAVRYDAQQNGITTGRYPDGADEFHELKTPTRNAANAAILHREIVINELMFNPISGNDDEEYIELYNKGGSAVDLTDWRLRNAVSFRFPAGTSIAAGGYLVIAKNAALLISRYPQLNTSNTLGDYSGTLANSGEKLQLVKPDDLLTPEIGLVVVDEVDYTDSELWGKWADGGGSSLELKDPHSDNSKAANWGDSDETAKAVWTTIERTAKLEQGTPATIDELQVFLLGAGEFLIDDVEVLNSSGVNTVKNGTFEGGSANWLGLGTHIYSGLETAEACSGTKSYHIRSAGSGDQNVNGVTGYLNTTMTKNATGTIRMKARWLKGTPSLVARLYGNWMELNATLSVPTNLGTPGQRNSNYVANKGPSIDDVSHFPVLPTSSQPATISATVNDPDGVSQVRCIYRIDPSATETTVNMTHVGRGVYQGTIPAQSTGTLVAYRIQATDSNATVSVFPEGAPAQRECLVKFGQTWESGKDFGTYSVWIRQADYNAWDARDVLSNLQTPCTFVYNDKRVSYFAGIRLRGSPLQRVGDQSKPPADAAWSYMIKLDSKTPFMGTTAIGTDFDPQLKEQMSFWLVEQLKHPSTHLRYIYMKMNTSVSQFDSAMNAPDDDGYLARWMPGDDKGDMYEIKYGNEYDGTYPNYKDSASIPGRATLSKTFNNGGDYRVESYRYVFDRKTPGARDNTYQGLFDLVAAWNDSSANKVAVWEAMVDWDGWFRGCAAHTLVYDQYGYGCEVAKNAYFYRKADGKWTLLTWDLDLAMPKWVDNSETATFFFSNDSTMMAKYNDPNLRRIYLDILREAAEGPMSASRYDTEADAWAAVLSANGQGQSASEMKTWIAARRNYILNTVLPLAPFAITTSNGNDFVSATTPVTLSGTAPVQARIITVNSNAYPVTWTTVTNWQVQVPMTQVGVNPLVVQGCDQFGVPVPGMQDSINVTFTGSLVSPVGWVVINEINHNPDAANAEYIEIYNRSTNQTFDLSNVEVNGAGFTFPGGAVIAPQEYIVVVKSIASFVAAYGNMTIAGEYSGTLDNGGETIALIKRGATPAEDVLIDSVRYDDELPWPASANGLGHSLQLRDPAFDNRRPCNWYAAVPTPKAPNSNTLTFSGIPEIWINEIQPSNVTGSQDNAGDSDPWMEIFRTGTWNGGSGLYFSDNPTNLTKWAFPSTETLGSAPYRIWADGEPGETVAGQPHTSFRLSPTGGVVIVSYQSTTNLLVLDVMKYGQVGAGLSFGSFPDGDPYNRLIMHQPTPGATNSALSSTNRVFINEWMASNLTTIQDPADLKYEDWFELYNPGSAAIDLTGYTLTDDLLNSDLWEIPAGTVIPAGGFLLIWADQNGTQNAPGVLHADFKLSASGESIGLFAPDGTQVDAVTFGAMAADEARGRLPDGSDTIGQTSPTPGSANLPGGVNTAPVIGSVTNVTADEGTPIQFTVGASDAEAPPQILTFSLLNEPIGASINPVTGVFTWSPSEAQGPSTNLITFVVTDNGSPALSTNTVATMIVRDVNSAPLGYDKPFSMKIHSGLSISMDLSAEDQDIPVQTVTYSLVAGAEYGASVNPQTGLFTWDVPVDLSGQDCIFTVRATDNGSPALYAEQSFTASVYEELKINLANVNFSNGQMVLRWDTIPGEGYALQYKSDLTGTNLWETVLMVTAADTSVVATNIPPAEFSHGFYRIQLNP